MDAIHWDKRYLSIYERLATKGRTTKLYYFDQASSSQNVVNLLKDQPALFGTFQDFLHACNKSQLPDYSSALGRCKWELRTEAPICGLSQGPNRRRKKSASGFAFLESQALAFLYHPIVHRLFR